MLEKTVAQSLAHFSSGLSFDGLTPKQRKNLSLFFLDWLGCALGGGIEAPPRMMLETVRELDGAPESTCIPDSSRNSCHNAALVNGCASHVLEMDDMHRESLIHPGAPVIPAALAMAERLHATGPELLLAMAVGYEVAIRTALGVGPSHYRYWHTTATCGVFGAAAAAAKLLGLDEQQTVWALGTAGTQAAGLWEFLAENAMSKLLHPGRAASAGILSALLARRGFTGVSTIMEGRQGFYRATSQDFDCRRATDGLGQVFVMDRSALKRHAACGHTHSAVDAALAAVNGRRVDPDQVERVEVKINGESCRVVHGVRPDTPYLAKFCVEFCVASALTRGPLGLEAFTAQTVADPTLRELAAKVTVTADPDMTRQYPHHWPAQVRVLFKDGTILEAALEHSKGDPENPLSEEEIREKFMGLACRAIPAARAAILAERALGLAGLDDVNRLLAP